MAMMRAAEERAITLYRQGKVPGSFYDGCGQEAISVGSAFALAAARPDVHPAPRPRRALRPRGDPGPLPRQLHGPQRRRHRRQGRQHALRRPRARLRRAWSRCSPTWRWSPTGMAMAFKLRGEPRVAMTYFGEGSTANGQWHEAMNFAGVHRLPVVFVLENNGFAYSTPNELEFAVDPVERAAHLRLPRRRRSTATTSRRCSRPRARPPSAPARATGPTLIECRTMRMHGHGAHDDMSYVPEEMLEEWARARPDRALRRAAGRRARVRRRARSSRSAARSRPTSTSAPQQGARLADARPGDRDRAACSPTHGDPLGDGHAPWSHWSAAQSDEVAA